jgi:hypothetical protein
VHGLHGGINIKALRNRWIVAMADVQGKMTSHMHVARGAGLQRDAPTWWRWASVLDDGINVIQRENPWVAIDLGQHGP